MVVSLTCRRQVSVMRWIRPDGRIATWSSSIVAPSWVEEVEDGACRKQPLALADTAWSVWRIPYCHCQLHRHHHLCDTIFACVSSFCVVVCRTFSNAVVVWGSRTCVSSTFPGESTSTCQNCQSKPSLVNERGVQESIGETGCSSIRESVPWIPVPS